MDKDLHRIIDWMINLADTYPHAIYSYRDPSNPISKLLTGDVYRLEDEVISHGSLLGQAIRLAFPGSDTYAKLKGLDHLDEYNTWWTTLVEFLGRDIDPDIGRALNNAQDEHDECEPWAHCILPLVPMQ